MHPVKKLWLFGWKVAIVAGLLGLGVLGIGLMVGAVVYSTGFFWGPIVFLMGLLGVLAVIGTGLTHVHRPESAA